MAKNQTSFKKGVSGNPKGKPKGVKNRTTEQMREFIKQVVDNNLGSLESDLAKMSNTNKWIILEKLTKYFLPALNKNDNQNVNSGDVTITVKYDEREVAKEDHKGNE